MLHPEALEWPMIRGPRHVSVGWRWFAERVPQGTAPLLDFIRTENRLPSFGQKLKSEREKRAITLDQISSSTKIGTRMLQALEEENFDQLPGGIFNKGFVRAYARHVGLDEDQTIAGYLQASGQNDAAKVELEVPATPEQPREPSSWPIPWGALAAVLLLLAVVLSLWNRRQHKNESFSQSHVPIPAEEVIPTPSAKTNLQQTVTPAKDVSAAPKPASAAPDSVLAAAPTIATQTGEFTVAILASEDSWLSIVVDGKNVFQDVLLAEKDRKSVV